MSFLALYLPSLVLWLIAVGVAVFGLLLSKKKDTIVAFGMLSLAIGVFAFPSSGSFDSSDYSRLVASEIEEKYDFKNVEVDLTCNWFCQINKLEYSNSDERFEAPAKVTGCFKFVVDESKAVNKTIDPETSSKSMI